LTVISATNIARKNQWNRRIKWQYAIYAIVQNIQQVNVHIKEEKTMDKQDYINTLILIENLKHEVEILEEAIKSSVKILTEE